MNSRLNQGFSAHDDFFGNNAKHEVFPLTNFLITRPDHDDVVFYLFEWSKELIEKARAKGINVLDCFGKRANKKDVEKMLKKKEPELVMFNGHGSPDCVCGQKNEILVKKGLNEAVLENKIVYARACASGKELGQSCVKKGAKAYIGYKEDFCFWVNNFTTATPLKDEFAKPFFEATNQIVESLLSGQTVAGSQARSLSVFDEKIEQFKRSNAPPEAEYILPLLYWDKNIQTIHGNENAKLEL